MKKIDHKQEIGSYLQVILGTFTIILGIMSIIEDDFFLIAELFIGLLMFVLAYNNHIVFKRKKFTKADLIELNEEASTKIFHEFASILRKHSVSDKPNAFNKIFNLFLAKLYDEAKGEDDELEFHWREDDNAVDFQVRLINLHKDGLFAFLEKIWYH